MDRVVTEADLRECALVDLEALACVRGCLTRFVQGRVGTAGSLSVPLAKGGADLGARLAPVDGLYSAALRVEGRGGDPPPAGRAGTLLVSPETGEIQALLLDDGYLGDLGRALAGAAGIAARAPEDAGRLAVLGGGANADLFVRAAALVRTLERVRVYDEDRDRARRLVGRLQESGVDAIAFGMPESALRDADLVLALGVAVDPDQLDPRATVVAVVEEPWPGRARGFDHAFADDPALSLLGATRALGDLTRGDLGAPAPRGRQLVELTGHPMLDTAVAFLAWRKSQKYKRGTVIPGA